MQIAPSSLLALPLLFQVLVMPAAAQGPTKVGVVLNFAADGGAAGFYHALERGYFRDAGLDVSIEPSKGSADAITRTASQASDIGVGDISTLVEFASRRPEIAPRAVFILHNRSPQAVISLRSSGIAKLTDLHGRILGQGPADAPSRMFPAVANLAGVDTAKIEIRQFSPQLRATMLISKQLRPAVCFPRIASKYGRLDRSCFPIKGAGKRLGTRIADFRPRNPAIAAKVTSKPQDGQRPYKIAAKVFLTRQGRHSGHDQQNHN